MVRAAAHGCELETGSCRGYRRPCHRTRGPGDAPIYGVIEDTMARHRKQREIEEQIQELERQLRLGAVPSTEAAEAVP